MKTVVKIGIILVILAGIAGSIAYYFIQWPNTTVNDEGIIFIQKEDNLENVLETLQQKEYLKNAYTFRKIAGLKKYSTRIKSGRYQIKDNMSNNELVNLLRSGNQAPIHFTFNNIRTMEQFAGVVSGQLNIDSVELLLLLRKPDYLNSLGFTQETVIGMFVPNTYQIYWNISTQDFINKMAGEYRKFWNEKRLQKAEMAGLSPMDAVILASIIEEETAKPEEYPIIAGVYINRLKKDIPLSACPTLKFALGDFTLKRILNKHLEVESPYNTYKYKGLPPGPVRMPSVNVIDAVLDYQKHDYLYFCAKSDFSGGHNFSRTLKQHNEYARQYHMELNKRKIY